MSNIMHLFRNKLNNQLTYELLYISSAKYGADWVGTGHTHHFTEIFFILNGAGIFKIQDSRVDVHENDIVIISPYIPHSEYSQETEPLEYVVFGIGGVAFSSDSSQSVKGYYRYNFSRRRSEIVAYLQSLLSELDKKEENYQLICHHLLEILLNSMMRFAGVNIVKDSTPRIKTECATIKRYIDDHFKENIDLNSLAALVHLNKYYLAHSFKLNMGMSPMCYLKEKRIEESKCLLKTTSLSVLEVSGRSGFSSLSYFSQAFKKSCGKSPGEYRNSHVD